jgi:predicted nucleic acid-binding Zn ribbon protein
MSTWRPTGPPPGERDPRPVSETLDHLARRLGGPRTSVLSAVFSRWEDLVGADIAAHARPVSLRQGTLVLAVDHPAWATQLRYMTGDLVARIRQVTASEDVTEIRLKVTGENPSRKR